MSESKSREPLTWFDRDVRASLGARADSMEQLLSAATCIRDIKDRANYELHTTLADGEAVALHLKRRKPQRGMFRSKAPEQALEAKGIRAASHAGVRVPELVCCGVDKKLGSLTVTRAVPSSLPLDQLLRERRLNLRQRRAVLFRLVRAVANLHDAGLHHRDLYLNHVYVDPTSAAPQPTVIDWERHGSHRGATGRFVVKDLAALLASARDVGVHRTDCLRFLSSYMTYRHLSIDAYGALLLEKVQTRAERIRAHAPRTPVGDAARPQAKDGRGS